MREKGITEIPVNPAVFLDLRSDPDVVPFGAFRYALNLEINEKKRLARMPGWRRFDYKDTFTNEDLHLYPSAVYAFYGINLIAQHKVGSKLVLTAANQSQVFIKSGTGWDPIYTSSRTNHMTPPWDEAVWSMGGYDQFLIFSNNVEEPVYHIYGQPVNSAGCYAEPVPELQELNVTKAGYVVSWNNVVFLMNLEMDGRRYPNRILWSDLKAPLSYVPSEVSAAGRHDLPAGEVVLSAKPLKDALLIYTNQSIYECRVTGRDDVFSFTRRHHSQDGAGCLVYKRTLVSTGDDHYFLGRDAWYKYNYYVSAPERTDWMDRATSLIFQNIDTSRCAVHCAGFDANRGQIWISWAKRDETLPSTSLLLGITNPFASVVDAGFTAFGTLEPKPAQTIADFLAQFDVCPASDTSPLNFYTAERLTLNPGTAQEVQVENYLKAAADTDSLYNRLYMKLADLCAAEDLGRDCATSPDFVMASSADFALKELCLDYFREIYSGGVLARFGYTSLMRSGAICLNEPRQRKVLHGFFLEAHADPAVAVGYLSLRVGTSSRALDPNVDEAQCFINWAPGLEPKNLDCLNPMTREEAANEGVEPDWTHAWPVWIPGHYLYWELTIGNVNSDPFNTGAGVSFSSFAIDCRRDSTRT